MNLLLISIAAATLGVEAGWQRLPDGGMEYIIQLDRHSLDALRDGQPIHSDVPPAAGEVRSYRIVFGNEALPREAPPERQTKAAAAQPPPALPPDPAVKPLAGRRTAFLQPESGTASAKETPSSPSNAPPGGPPKPWLPFTLALFGLFASLGANAYLGWLFWGLRRRFRNINIENDVTVYRP